ncbi:transposase [Streptomyces platensis]|uniref:transposase n=1 Tax=Streptomyces platensis TaxID=58346 RepID=UPI00386C65A0
MQNRVERSSGSRQYRRLNRGGDRQANAALHRIVQTRLCFDPRTQDYYERRIKEGKTDAKSPDASNATLPARCSTWSDPYRQERLLQIAPCRQQCRSPFAVVVHALEALIVKFVQHVEGELEICPVRAVALDLLPGRQGPRDQGRRRHPRPAYPALGRRGPRPARRSAGSTGETDATAVSAHDDGPVSRETVRHMLLGMSLPKWSAVQWVLEALHSMAEEPSGEANPHSIGPGDESSRDALHRAWGEARLAARNGKQQRACVQSAWS